jgi:hypothetical protein
VISLPNTRTLTFGGIDLINLFRQGVGAAEGLTAPLLALLEHVHPELRDQFLSEAGLPAPVDQQFRVQYPAPAGPPEAGLLGETLLLTQTPGQPVPQPPGDTPSLIITLGRPPQSTHGLTWEQVERWIESGTSRFDAETRTGFLLRQFQSFLRVAGIEYFAGFPAEQVAGTPAAFRLLSEFHTTTDGFFDRLLVAVRDQFGPGPTESAAELRQSRPEDLLAGYNYRDYSLAIAGPGSFLRVALNLAESELQLSCWLAVGTEAHRRLRHALHNQTQIFGLPPGSVLRLWSQTDERHISLDDLPVVEPLPETEWNQFQAGLQFGRTLDFLAGDDLVGRVLPQIEHLTQALDALLSEAIH